MDFSESSTTIAMEGPTARVRDPERAEKILTAAEALFGSRGFHEVSLADIGREAGIVGSGVYRHFDSKVAVLRALLDRSLSALLERADAILREERPAEETLEALIGTQVDYCLDDRFAVRLYRTEMTALPEESVRRLRRLQRRYISEWVGILIEIRPELEDVRARSLVHAAIGAIHSSVYFRSGLPRETYAPMLTQVAWQVLRSPVGAHAHTPPESRATVD
ncbi:TetR/AcrR family transcriptional regulator [Kribbia dieselivorans]|uniref:TetR/AcrR family transcriptional regulator n=1 Tax=Kribbia dieselivorans TaxID=331526 RepID=UPI001C3F331A|nr:TetR/AcrR family transcriptional regulator [Kribbia dieselivorans]